MRLPDRATLGLAALVLLGAPARSVAGEVGASCTIAVAADPPRLEAEAPRAVRLRVTATAPPRLTASLGSLGASSPDGEGAFVAEWTAPPAGIPQVALLTALSDGDCGFVAVPLTGSGEAVVRTRPGARVEVQIGDRHFGPEKAGPDGVALVPVEVPPGVDAVFHGTRRIPLDLPPTAHVALAAEVDAAPADRGVAVSLLVVAVDAAGNPRVGPPPALTATAGALTPATPAGAGAFRATWRLPPGPSAEVAVRAQLPGEPPVELKLARPAGAPATAVARLERSAASAGDAPLLVEVALTDAAGNPADGSVEAAADLGSFGAVERVAAGAYRTRYAVPEELHGHRKASLSFQAGEARARAEVALRPASPAHLTLFSSQTVLTADGRADLGVTAVVEDGHGNPVDEPPTGATAGAGDVGAPRPAGPGRFLIRYRPARVTRFTEDEVAVKLPPLAATLTVHLRPPTPWLTLGASAGLALRPGLLGLEADAEVSSFRWLFGEELGASLGVAFSRFRDTRTVTTSTGTTAVVGEVQDLALLASAAWRRAVGRTLCVKAEVGAGPARVTSLVSAGGGPLVPESGWVMAASAAASVGLPLGHGRATLTLRGTLLADARLDSLRGSPSPISLSLGYELDAP
jgi:hypothetical protein